MSLMILNIHNGMWKSSASGCKQCFVGRKRGGGWLHTLNCAQVKDWTEVLTWHFWMRPRSSAEPRPVASFCGRRKRPPVQNTALDSEQMAAPDNRWAVSDLWCGGTWSRQGTDTRVSNLRTSLFNLAGTEAGAGTWQLLKRPLWNGEPMIRLWEVRWRWQIGAAGCRVT